MSTSVEAKRVFASIGPNFMTDEPVEYGWINDDLVYEIARGTGIVGEEIWGVSVRSAANPAMSQDGSEMVLSREAANEWVEILREEN